MGCEIVIGGADTETRETVEALFAARDRIFSRFRDDDFSGQTNVVNVGSSSGPALADLNGKLYLAWTGVPGDTRLYFSSLG